MPSKSRRQHNLMEAAAHGAPWAKRLVPAKVANDFVSADKASGKFKGKAKTMAKHKMGGMKGMDGSEGMSPRKSMASGLHEADTGSGGFGVKSFSEAQGHSGDHPDHTAGTGRMGHMEDGDRAIGEPIHHTKGHFPAQAAPNHGPTHVDGHGMSEHHRRK